jgi:hypothetical protein
VQGSDAVVVRVTGRLDASAAVGFHALMDWLVRVRDVTIDLTRCDALDPDGHRAVTAELRRIAAAGGTARVHH